MGDRMGIIFIILCMGLVGFYLGDVYATEVYCDPHYEYRSFNGTCNNLENPLYGSAGSGRLRKYFSYYNSTSFPLGDSRPSARVISNNVSFQSVSMPNSFGASDFIWQWGQFLDHDLDLTSSGPSMENFDIKVPRGDTFFDPNDSGNKVIPLIRSIHNGENPRQQINQITAFIDASNVYGSDYSTAQSLRDSKISSKLATSKGNLLPESNGFFIAGDVRANEQIGLTAMHTLFVREHNQVVDEISKKNPKFSDEQVYQIARKIIGAEIQVITYNEFLPKLLGENAIPPYTGYNSAINPGITNEFSTASFRYGHTQLSPNLMIIDNSYMSHIPLRDAFFNPSLFKEKGMDAILRGFASQKAQEIDAKIVDDVRNFLFGPPGSGGFDLASLNIQRGRDHGIPDYNSVRFAYGLEKVTSFSQITSDIDLQNKLILTYGDVNAIDLWVGGLSEDNEEGAMVGETVRTILIDQFTRLRDGDRFWYQNDQFFVQNPTYLKKVSETTLSEIIKRNSQLNDSKIQDDVFLCQYMKGGGFDKKHSEFEICK